VGGRSRFPSRTHRDRPAVPEQARPAVPHRHAPPRWPIRLHRAQLRIRPATIETLMRWRGGDDFCESMRMPLFTDLPPASFRSFDGTMIRYHRAGDGSPVIMIHGSGGGLHSWQPVAEHLPDRFELWLPARRGYAPSGPGHAPKHFADEVRDLGTIIDMIGRPAHLVGMSYG